MLINNNEIWSVEGLDNVLMPSVGGNQAMGMIILKELDNEKMKGAILHMHY